MRTYPNFGVTATFSLWPWLVRVAVCVWLPVASFGAVVWLGRMWIEAAFR